MAESSNATTYVPVPDTVDPLESSEVTVMFITAALVSLILANATSTCIHRCGHDSKTGRSRNWVQSFPESMIVLTYGLIVGLVLLLIVTLATDKSSEEVISEQLLSAAIFQADTFNLVLLPIIIFTSGFTLKPKSLFFNLIFPILVLAILGTLICAAIIGGGVYVLMTVLPAMPLYTVSIYTAMTYGSLLAAIDPVATLSIFVNLKVDPVLSMLLFGESVINDAVSIVLFEVFAIYATALPDDLADLPVSAGFILFFKAFFGSIGIAMLVTLLSALFLKFLKPEHDLHQTIVIFFFSYLSFEVADALYLSGITSSLFSGIFMGYLVPKNLSPESTDTTKKIFTMVAEMAESIVFFQIGVNSVITLNQMSQLWMTALGVFMLCLFARLVAVPLQLGLLNLCRRKEKRFTTPQAVIMIHAGLRGAIAYALCLQFPVFAFQEVATNITTFVILLSIFLIGPSTAPLLRCMKIPLNVPYQVNTGRLYYSKWQTIFDNLSRKIIVKHFSLGRSRGDSMASPGPDTATGERRERLIGMQTLDAHSDDESSTTKTYATSIAVDVSESHAGGAHGLIEERVAGTRDSVESVAPASPPRRRRTDAERAAKTDPPPPPR